MKKEKKTRRVLHLVRGLTNFTTLLLAVSIAIVPIVNTFRTNIDGFLGTSSTELIIGEDEDLSALYHYTSDYDTTTQLVQAIAGLGEEMEEEGVVLLKNNGALPLSQAEKGCVTLLGFSSYYPVMGGDIGGSVITPNSGTDADTVDFVEALTAKGFQINPDVQKIYMDNKEFFLSETAGFSQLQMTQSYSIPAPALGDVFTSKELPQRNMDGWQSSTDNYNVMLVTLARSGSENRSYLPGEQGVNAEQNLNQSDALGLSDDERDLIDAAVEAKAANGGKVIVLLNNSNAMEIDELKRNDGVDAILEIGFPGGYGFYGVADILSGDANPSGKLADTYAVDNDKAPSAQNYGQFDWTNGNANISMYSAYVEAESIYIGYKYYETRYIDSVLGRGNASSNVGSTDGSDWSYDNEVSYPFGYGLSYTTFTQTLDSVDVDLASRTVTAKVTVTNTGNTAGKDVVQLYVSAPYTAYDQEHGVEKAGVQLLDYEKTDEIAPGDSVTITIHADAQYMASWDSTAPNAADTTGCYILDPGDYYFALGNGAHEAANNVLAAQGKTAMDGMTADGDTVQSKTWHLDAFDRETFALTKNGTAVENQLADADLNYWLPDTVTYLSRSDWSGTFPETYSGLTATDAMLDVLDNDNYEITANGDPSSVIFGADNGLTLPDLRGVTDLEDERWKLLMDQITLEECMIRIAFGGTSTKAINSIVSPEAVQNDGPNGIYSYPLGRYASKEGSGDPYTVSDDEPNAGYMAGVMPGITLMGQTFSKEMMHKYGQVMGNYSLWANLPIWWGGGCNIHRSPYNARNYEYFSEDGILSGYQCANLVAGGLEYGLIIAPKHYAQNDTEIDRKGVAVFLNEQMLRENELRCYQPAVEDAGVLGMMTAYNRIGCLSSNSHTGLMYNILRQEWGFKGLVTEDMIRVPNYNALKEAAINGITMTCQTGADSVDAVAKLWPYWTVKNISQDATLLAALKQDMTWQAYALANSNAMEGYPSSARVVSVRTSYDKLITKIQLVFAVLTILLVALYMKLALRKTAKENDTAVKKRRISFGLFLTALSAIAVLVGLIAYIINCNTNYFSIYGISAYVVICFVAAVLCKAAQLVIGMRRQPIWLDFVTIVSTVFTVLGMFALISARLDGMAAIMTYQYTAANVADLSSALFSIVACLVSLFFGIFAAFFDVSKER